MPYATSSEVIDLLTPGGDYDGSTDLTQFIRTADVWVRQMLACAATKEYTFTDEDLAVIANWLTAHAYVMSDATYVQKQTDRSSGTFRGKTGMRFEASLYGQTAMSLDGSGCLEAMNNPQKKVGAFWGGKNPGSQIPYDPDRRET